MDKQWVHFRILLTAHFNLQYKHFFNVYTLGVCMYVYLVFANCFRLKLGKQLSALLSLFVIVFGHFLPILILILVVNLKES